MDIYAVQYPPEPPIGARIWDVDNEQWKHTTKNKWTRILPDETDTATWSELLIGYGPLTSEFVE